MAPRTLPLTLISILSISATGYVHSHLTTYTNGWNAHFGYTILTAGEYMVQLKGQSCKQSHLGLVILNAAATITGDLEATARDYFNHTYPFAAGGFSCAANSWAGEASGTTYCPRKLLMQDTATRGGESNYKYEVLALTSDLDNARTDVPFFEIQFNTSSDHTCASTMAAMSGGGAHAGHNHARRDNGHRRSGSTMTMVVEFPSTKHDGTAQTYPSNWYFFSDQNLTAFKIDVMRESPFLEIEQLSHEVLADPAACPTPAAASAKTCACNDDSDCEDDKYMWSGIIFVVGLIGLVSVHPRSISTLARSR